MYIIKATNPAKHIGTFMVKGSLSDSQLLKPFTFSVLVTNKSPRFVGGVNLEDAEVGLESLSEI
jgi:hypothetical protein